MKKFTVGEICFIVMGMFVPATTAFMNVWSLLIISPLCAIGTWYLYNLASGENKK